MRPPWPPRRGVRARARIFRVHDVAPTAMRWPSPRRSRRRREAPVIEIVGLEVFAHHGVHTHERRDGQTFLFDIRLVCPSAAADRLTTSTIDYGAVATGWSSSPVRPLPPARAAGRGDRRRPAGRLPGGRRDRHLHKPQAPIPHPFADVTATVIRPDRPIGARHGSGNP